MYLGLPESRCSNDFSLAPWSQTRDFGRDSLPFYNSPSFMQDAHTTEDLNCIRVQPNAFLSSVRKTNHGAIAVSSRCLGWSERVERDGPSPQVSWPWSPEIGKAKESQGILQFAAVGQKPETVTLLGGCVFEHQVVCLSRLTESIKQHLGQCSLFGWQRKPRVQAVTLKFSRRGWHQLALDTRLPV